MNDPVRLRETNDAARALLSAGKLRVPRGARQRALAFTGVAAGVATTGTAAAAGATALFKSVVVCVCLGTVGGGVASLAVSETMSRLSGKPAEAQPPVAARPAKAVEKPRAAPVAIPKEEVAPVPAEPAAEEGPRKSTPSDSRSSTAVGAGVSPAPAPPNNPSKAPRAPSLFDEQRMIESARAAVSRGDAQAALTTLDGYERIYTRGQFGPEALALRIEALSARGDVARSRRLASEFQRRYPHHPLLSSVQAAAQGSAGAGR